MTFFGQFTSGIKALGRKANAVVRGGVKAVKRGAQALGNIASTVASTAATEIMGVKHIPSKVRFWAQFADQAYYPDRQADIGNYKFISSMSENRKLVWKKDPNTYVIAYRGTSLVDAADYVADAYIVAALEAAMPRVLRGVAEAEALLHQGNKVILTGHSLGGGIAMEVLRQIRPDLINNIQAFAYDPGFAKVEYRASPNWEKKLSIYRTTGDPISFTARSVKARENITYQKKDPTMIAHRLEQLL